MAEERILPLADVPGDSAPYFSTILVRRPEEIEQKLVDLVTGVLSAPLSDETLRLLDERAGRAPEAAFLAQRRPDPDRPDRSDR